MTSVGLIISKLKVSFLSAYKYTVKNVLFFVQLFYIAIFWQLTACDYRLQSLALFQNIFKFLYIFAQILKFFALFQLYKQTCHLQISLEPE